MQLHSSWVFEDPGLASGVWNAEGALREACKRISLRTSSACLLQSCGPEEPSSHPPGEGGRLCRRRPGGPGELPTDDSLLRGLWGRLCGPHPHFPAPSHVAEESQGSPHLRFGGHPPPPLLHHATPLTIIPRYGWGRSLIIEGT